MHRLMNLSPRTVSLSLMVAGAAFAAAGVTQIVDSQRDTGTDVVGFAGHFMLGMFALGLVASGPGFLALSRYARSTKGAVAAAIGTTVLGLTCLTSVVNGEDLSLFNVLAPLTNAAWLFGSIALAVSLKKAGRVRVAVSVGLPLVWVASIPLSAFGGGLLAGAYWTAVAHLLANDALEQGPAPQPARA